jgi:hypothetical protein
LENRFVHNKLEAVLFEEMRRIDLLWEIVKYTASLLWIFNVYEFCCFKFLPKNINCFPFQRSSKGLFVWAKVIPVNERTFHDKFTSEISPCYENNKKSYISFIWDEKFSRVPRSRLLTGEISVTRIMFSPYEHNFPA